MCFCLHEFFQHVCVIFSVFVRLKSTHVSYQHTCVNLSWGYLSFECVLQYFERRFLSLSVCVSVRV